MPDSPSDATIAADETNDPDRRQSGGSGTDDRLDTPGGQPQERVEDRPNVGTVKPEDYPQRDRERRN